MAGKWLPAQWPQNRRDDPPVPALLSDERVRETVRVGEDGSRDTGNGAEDGRGEGRDGAEDGSGDSVYKAEDRGRDWTDGAENGPRDTVYDLQKRSEEPLGRAARQIRGMQPSVATVLLTHTPYVRFWWSEIQLLVGH